MQVLLLLWIRLNNNILSSVAFWVDAGWFFDRELVSVFLFLFFFMFFFCHFSISNIRLVLFSFFELEYFPFSNWNIFLCLIGIFSFLLTFLFGILLLFFHDIFENSLFARGHGTVCRSCFCFLGLSFYFNLFN